MVVDEQQVAGQNGAPTINDVAALAEVSRQTVSNVLNAPQRVSAHTRERVEQAIVQLGYHPNRGARNLRSQATRLLGYRVSPAPSGSINIVLDRFLHALSATAGEHGYQLLLFASSDGPGELAAYDELLRSKAVDGFVLSETNYGDPRIAHLRRAQVPFSVFGRTGNDQEHGWVDVDNAAGTRQAVEHLIATGRRDIAFVGWPEGSMTGDERARGYREALQAAGLPVRDGWQGRGVDSLQSGLEAAERWLDGDAPPDAVVAASDLLAIGVVRAARRRGIGIGSELAVTGFDDTPTAALLDPPLTSVRQPIEEVAGHIVRRLIADIAGHRPEPDDLLVASTLIVRDSSSRGQ